MDMFSLQGERRNEIIPEEYEGSNEENIPQVVQENDQLKQSNESSEQNFQMQEGKESNISHGCLEEDNWQDCLEDVIPQDNQLDEGKNDIILEKNQKDGDFEGCIKVDVKQNIKLGNEVEESIEVYNAEGNQLDYNVEGSKAKCSPQHIRSDDSDEQDNHFAECAEIFQFDNYVEERDSIFIPCFNQADSQKEKSSEVITPQENLYNKSLVGCLEESLSCISLLDDHLEEPIEGLSQRDNQFGNNSHGCIEYTIAEGNECVNVGKKQQDDDLKDYAEKPIPQEHTTEIDLEEHIGLPISNSIELLDQEVGKSEDIISEEEPEDENLEACLGEAVSQVNKLGYKLTDFIGRIFPIGIQQGNKLFDYGREHENTELDDDKLDDRLESCTKWFLSYSDAIQTRGNSIREGIIPAEIQQGCRQQDCTKEIAPQGNQLSEELREPIKGIILQDNALANNLTGCLKLQGSRIEDSDESNSEEDIEQGPEGEHLQDGAGENYPLGNQFYDQLRWSNGEFIPRFKEIDDQDEANMEDIIPEESKENPQREGCLLEVAYHDNNLCDGSEREQYEPSQECVVNIIPRDERFDEELDYLSSNPNKLHDLTALADIPEYQADDYDKSSSEEGVSEGEEVDGLEMSTEEVSSEGNQFECTEEHITYYNQTEDQIENSRTHIIPDGDDSLKGVNEELLPWYNEQVDQKKGNIHYLVTTPDNELSDGSEKSTEEISPHFGDNLGECIEVIIPSDNLLDDHVSNEDFISQVNCQEVISKECIINTIPQVDNIFDDNLKSSDEEYILTEDLAETSSDDTPPEESRGDGHLNICNEIKDVLEECVEWIIFQDNQSEDNEDDCIKDIIADHNPLHYHAEEVNEGGFHEENQHVGGLIAILEDENFDDQMEERMDSVRSNSNDSNEQDNKSSDGYISQESQDGDNLEYFPETTAPQLHEHLEGSLEQTVIQGDNFEESNSEQRVSDGEEECFPQGIQINDYLKRVNEEFIPQYNQDDDHVENTSEDIVAGENQEGHLELCVGEMLSPGDKLGDGSETSMNQLSSENNQIDENIDEAIEDIISSDVHLDDHVGESNEGIIPEENQQDKYSKQCVVNTLSHDDKLDDRLKESIEWLRSNSDELYNDEEIYSHRIISAERDNGIVEILPSNNESKKSTEGIFYEDNQLDDNVEQCTVIIPESNQLEQDVEESSDEDIPLFEDQVEDCIDWIRSISNDSDDHDKKRSESAIPQENKDDNNLKYCHEQIATQDNRLARSEQHNHQKEDSEESSNKQDENQQDDYSNECVANTIPQDDKLDDRLKACIEWIRINSDEIQDDDVEICKEVMNHEESQEGGHLSECFLEVFSEDNAMSHEFMKENFSAENQLDDNIDESIEDNISPYQNSDHHIEEGIAGTTLEDRQEIDHVVEYIENSIPRQEIQLDNSLQHSTKETITGCKYPGDGLEDIVPEGSKKEEYLEECLDEANHLSGDFNESKEGFYPPDNQLHKYLKECWDPQDNLVDDSDKGSDNRSASEEDHKGDHLDESAEGNISPRNQFNDSLNACSEEFIPRCNQIGGLEENGNGYIFPEAKQNEHLQECLEVVPLDTESEDGLEETMNKIVPHFDDNLEEYTENIVQDNQVGGHVEQGNAYFIPEENQEVDHLIVIGVKPIPHGDNFNDQLEECYYSNEDDSSEEIIPKENEEEDNLDTCLEKVYTQDNRLCNVSEEMLKEIIPQVNMLDERLNDCSDTSSNDERMLEEHEGDDNLDKCIAVIVPPNTHLDDHVYSEAIISHGNQQEYLSKVCVTNIVPQGDYIFDDYLKTADQEYILTDISEKTSRDRNLPEEIRDHDHLDMCNDLKDGLESMNATFSQDKQLDEYEDDRITDITAGDNPLDYQADEGNESLENQHVDRLKAILKIENFDDQMEKCMDWVRSNSNDSNEQDNKSSNGCISEEVQDDDNLEYFPETTVPQLHEHLEGSLEQTDVQGDNFEESNSEQRVSDGEEECFPQGIQINDYLKRVNEEFIPQYNQDDDHVENTSEDIVAGENQEDDHFDHLDECYYNSEDNSCEDTSDDFLENAYGQDNQLGNVSEETLKEIIPRVNKLDESLNDLSGMQADHYIESSNEEGMLETQEGDVNLEMIAKMGISLGNQFDDNLKESHDEFSGWYIQRDDQVEDRRECLSLRENHDDDQLDEFIIQEKELCCCTKESLQLMFTQDSQLGNTLNECITRDNELDNHEEGRSEVVILQENREAEDLEDFLGEITPQDNQVSDEWKESNEGNHLHSNLTRPDDSDGSRSFEVDQLEKCARRVFPEGNQFDDNLYEWDKEFIPCYTQIEDQGENSSEGIIPQVSHLGKCTNWIRSNGDELHGDEEMRRGYIITEEHQAGNPLEGCLDEVVPQEVDNNLKKPTEAISPPGNQLQENVKEWLDSDEKSSEESNFVEDQEDDILVDDEEGMFPQRTQFKNNLNECNWECITHYNQTEGLEENSNEDIIPEENQEDVYLEELPKVDVYEGNQFGDNFHKHVKEWCDPEEEQVDNSDQSSTDESDFEEYQEGGILENGEQGMFPQITQFKNNLNEWNEECIPHYNQTEGLEENSNEDIIPEENQEDISLEELPKVVVYEGNQFGVNFHKNVKEWCDPEEDQVDNSDQSSTDESVFEEDQEGGILENGEQGMFPQITQFKNNLNEWNEECIPHYNQTEGLAENSSKDNIPEENHEYLEEVHESNQLENIVKEYTEEIYVPDNHSRWGVSQEDQEGYSDQSSSEDSVSEEYQDNNHLEECTEERFPLENQEFIPWNIQIDDQKESSNEDITDEECQGNEHLEEYMEVIPQENGAGSETEEWRAMFTLQNKLVGDPDETRNEGIFREEENTENNFENCPEVIVPYDSQLTRRQECSEINISVYNQVCGDEEKTAGDPIDQQGDKLEECTEECRMVNNEVCDELEAYMEGIFIRRNQLESNLDEWNEEFITQDRQLDGISYPEDEQNNQEQWFNGVVPQGDQLGDQLESCSQIEDHVEKSSKHNPIQNQQHDDLEGWTAVFTHQNKQLDEPEEMWSKQINLEEEKIYTNLEEYVGDIAPQSNHCGDHLKESTGGFISVNNEINDQGEHVRKYIVPEENLQVNPLGENEIGDDLEETIKEISRQNSQLDNDLEEWLEEVPPQNNGLDVCNENSCDKGYLEEDEQNNLGKCNGVIFLQNNQSGNHLEEGVEYIFAGDNQFDDHLPECEGDVTHNKDFPKESQPHHKMEESLLSIILKEYQEDQESIVMPCSKLKTIPETSRENDDPHESSNLKENEEDHNLQWEMEDKIPETYLQDVKYYVEKKCDEMEGIIDTEWQRVSRKKQFTAPREDFHSEIRSEFVVDITEATGDMDIIDVTDIDQEDTASERSMLGAIHETSKDKSDLYVRGQRMENNEANNLQWGMHQKVPEIYFQDVNYYVEKECFDMENIIETESQRMARKIKGSASNADNDFRYKSDDSQQCVRPILDEENIEECIEEICPQNNQSDVTASENSKVVIFYDEEEGDYLESKNKNKVDDENLRFTDLQRMTENTIPMENQEKFHSESRSEFVVDITEATGDMDIIDVTDIDQEDTASERSMLGAIHETSKEKSDLYVRGQRMENNEANNLQWGMHQKVPEIYFQDVNYYVEKKCFDMENKIETESQRMAKKIKGSASNADNDFRYKSDDSQQCVRPILDEENIEECIEEICPQNNQSDVTASENSKVVIFYDEEEGDYLESKNKNKVDDENLRFTDLQRMTENTIPMENQEKFHSESRSEFVVDITEATGDMDIIDVADIDQEDTASERSMLGAIHETSKDKSDLYVRGQRMENNEANNLQWGMHQKVPEIYFQDVNYYVEKKCFDMENKIETESQRMARKVKGTKSKKDNGLQYKSNRSQYLFNARLIEDLREAHTLVEQRFSHRPSKLMASLIDDVTKRNKLISLVDNSPVEENLASESIDESFMTGDRGIDNELYTVPRPIKRRRSSAKSLSEEKEEKREEEEIAISSFQTLRSYFDNTFSSMEKKINAEAEHMTEAMKCKQKDENDSRYKGHEIEYSFNLKLLEDLQDAYRLTEQRSVRRSSKLIKDIITKLVKRNKILRLIDQPSIDWDTTGDEESFHLINESSDGNR